jgi:hypothetical protein
MIARTGLFRPDLVNPNPVPGDLLKANSIKWKAVNHCLDGFDRERCFVVYNKLKGEYQRMES